MAYTITAACIGCTACAKLCPVEAICGFRGAQHTVRAKRCVSCGVCGRVCPKSAVRNESGVQLHPVPRKLWRNPAIDTALCSACSMCVSVCHAEALRISAPAFPGDIRVFAELYDPSACVGCGLCVRECPLHAIRMQEADA